MIEHGTPVAFALLTWWFSTGLVLYLDGLPHGTFRWSMAAATVLLLGSLVGIVVTADDVTPFGAYAGFTFGVLAWAWHELSFLTGLVTGPRRTGCVEGCHGWRHFVHGVQAILYHELAIIATALVIVALTWRQPNQTATWTFVILLGMRQSAKLNLFLGARNLSEEFLPEHLRYLRSYFRRKTMNPLFPVSVTVPTVIVVVLARDAIAPGTDAFGKTSSILLASMLGLAVLEHWLMMLPLSANALWSWGLRSRAAAPDAPQAASIGRTA